MNPSPKPKKHIITVTIDTFSPYEFEGEIEKVIEWMQEKAKQYPGASFDYDSTYWEQYSNSPSPRFELKMDREETDEEFEKRLEQERVYAEKQLAADRKLLAELKARLGE